MLLLLAYSVLLKNLLSQEEEESREQASRAVHMKTQFNLHAEGRRLFLVDDLTWNFFKWHPSSKAKQSKSKDRLWLLGALDRPMVFKTLNYIYFKIYFNTYKILFKV